MLIGYSDQIGVGWDGQSVPSSFDFTNSVSINASWLCV